MKERMGSRGFKEKLEVTTSVMVILGVLLFGFLLYRSITDHAKSPVEAPTVGMVLPALPGYSWDGHSQVLLLALRKRCHFCEDSMPFYRELLQVEKSGGSKARLLSVLPDGEAEATYLMREAQLDVPMVTSFPLQQLHVSGTPTLILVAGNGSVEKVWVGEQDASGQRAIFDAIRK